MQVSRQTPDDVLRHALRVVRKGYGFPSLFNADAVVEEVGADPGLLRIGVLDHPLLGAIEGANGLLLFGWSTAFLIRAT